jgi:hypothetical protein
MPLILGANSVTGGYEVDNSLRFNSGSSDSLTRTNSDNGTSNQIFTMSLWIKKTSNDSAVRRLIELYNTSSFYVSFRFRDDSSSRLDFYSESNGVGVNLRTNRSFRDVSAWYHLMMVVNTTLATADDRMKMYVNGVQETSFALRTNPSLNENLDFNNSGDGQYVGRAVGTETDRMFNGYMSEINFIDGQALAPSDFGEFDDSGIWKPIAYTGTYGTNGFYLEFKDSSALGDDTSGEGNDFTVNNLTSIDQTTDTPTNNFPTLNSIWGDDISAGSMTYSNGNTTYEPTTNGNSYTRSTFGMSNKGKWYAEMKVTEVNTGQSASLTVTPDTNFGASTDSGYGFQVQLNAANTVLNKVVGGTATSINNSFASGSIAMLAVDLDNGKMWVGYNGTWYNDNNPSSTLDVSNPDGTGISTSYDYIYGFQAYWQTGGYYDIADVNFGNPSFAISSGNSDANGYGNFEYEVPSGFYALNTKNLAEYG